MAAARTRPSTSVIVLSEALSETARISDKGAESTEAMTLVPSATWERVMSPSILMPAAVSAVAKAWAASMAGSWG